MQEIRNLQERKEPGWELLLKAELLKIWQGYYSAAEKNGGKRMPRRITVSVE